MGVHFALSWEYKPKGAERRKMPLTDVALSAKYICLYNLQVGEVAKNIALTLLLLSQLSYVYKE